MAYFEKLSVRLGFMAVALVWASEASAQEALLCEPLAAIVANAKMDFAGLKTGRPDKTEYGVDWQPSVRLPYGSRCLIHYSKSFKKTHYTCDYLVSGGRDASAEMLKFADSIAACQPAMVRSGDGKLTEFDSNDAEISLSFQPHYPHEFTLYVEMPKAEKR